MKLSKKLKVKEYQLMIVKERKEKCLKIIEKFKVKI